MEDKFTLLSEAIVAFTNKGYSLVTHSSNDSIDTAHQPGVFLFEKGSSSSKVKRCICLDLCHNTPELIFLDGGENDPLQTKLSGKGLNDEYNLHSCISALSEYPILAKGTPKEDSKLKTIRNVESQIIKNNLPYTVAFDCCPVYVFRYGDGEEDGYQLTIDMSRYSLKHLPIWASKFQCAI